MPMLAGSVDAGIGVDTHTDTHTASRCVGRSSDALDSGLARSGRLDEFGEGGGDWHARREADAEFVVPAS